MNKLIILLAAFGIASAVLAQSSDYSVRNVRDPIQLQSKLNTDGAATEARLTALEGSTNVNGAGAFASITLSGATGIVSSAASATVATNATPTAGLLVRVNGTNYLIKLFPN